MQPMGTRLGIDHQQLQQFVSASPWKAEPVRRRLAALAVGTIQSEAWVIDDTGFKKDGTASPCVARQYSGTLGKIGNCQIGVSIHVATDAASCPVNWRLFIPESWNGTCAETREDAERIQARCERSRLPDTARNQTKWSMGLEMVWPCPRFVDTALAEAGVDLAVMQTLLGHTHVDTTARYIHLAPAQVKAEYDAARNRQRSTS